MGLDELVRFGVSLANTLTDSLQADNIVHAAWIGTGTSGEPLYGAPVIRKAIVEYKQKLSTDKGGQEIMQQASVFFVGPVPINGAAERREPIDPRDQIILQNGYTGPILSINGVVDPTTDSLYTVEVILG